MLICIKQISNLQNRRKPSDTRPLGARGVMIRIDVHQHIWTEPLVRALSERDELPFVRREHGLTVLFLASERPM